MKLLANENIPLGTVRHLRTLGYNVWAISESMAGSTDDAVLAFARDHDRILITFDRDYGTTEFFVIPAQAGILSSVLGHLIPADVEIVCAGLSKLLG
ncbi:MAG: DUF5615 family PIN-like protein [Magnetococcales bacterium]|nr:DUF5615 family PIN-like protein [Magnetococcales bacterium]